MENMSRRTDGWKRGTVRFPALPALFLALMLCCPPWAAAAPEVPAAPAAAPAGPAGVPALSPEPSPDAFHYDPTGRRDPFKSLLILQEKKRDVSMLPPIQQAELNAFKVQGIIMDKVGGNRAMVQGPDGKTYVIKKGDIIGKNEGEVLSIDISGIVVREKFVDYMNKETTTTSVLKVAEKQKL